MMCGIEIIADFTFILLYFHIIYSIQSSPSIDENQSIIEIHCTYDMDF